jgi:nitrogen fixation protein FixH
MAYPAKVARQKELGWTFNGSAEKLTVGQPGNFILSITDKDGRPVREAKVSMTVSRPASREALPVVQAKEQENGDYMAQITVPAYGHWLVNVTINRQDDEFDFEYKVYASKGGVNANG